MYKNINQVKIKYSVSYIEYKVFFEVSKKANKNDLKQWIKENKNSEFDIFTEINFRVHFFKKE
jgi:hypothetical protein